MALVLSYNQPVLKVKSYVLPGLHVLKDYLPNTKTGLQARPVPYSFTQVPRL